MSWIYEHSLALIGMGSVCLGYILGIEWQCRRRRWLFFGDTGEDPRS